MGAVLSDWMWLCGSVVAAMLMISGAVGNLVIFGEFDIVCCAGRRRAVGAIRGTLTLCFAQKDEPMERTSLAKQQSRGGARVRESWYLVTTCPAI